MSASEPPYRASLEYALAHRNATRITASVAEPPTADSQQARAWAERVCALGELLRGAQPDWETLADATRLQRLGRPGERMANQVFILTRGLTPITTRCFAALVASELGDWGCTVFDTGMPDTDAARLAGFLRGQGIDISMYRGDSMRIAEPDNCAALWGGAPEYMLLMNDDTVPLPGFCQRLTRVMDNNRRIKLVSAVSNTPLDGEIYRPGFEDGPDETLLERIWNFARQRWEVFGDDRGPCVQANFTCAALDWHAWRAAMPTPTPFDHGHHFDLHCGFCLLEAGHQLATAEGCAIFHVGHATYSTTFSESEIYDTVLERTRKLIDVWGHRPELPGILHAGLAAATNFRHH